MLVVTLVLASGACEEAQLQGAAADVKKTTVTLDLPAVPSFDLPKSQGDVHGVRELRLLGGKLLGTELRVAGYVTWIYSCLEAHMTGEATEQQVQKKIDDDPTLCQRPHFYLGDEPGTAPEKSLWVVEVPRKLRKDELRQVPREERKNLPPVPEIALGDEVIVTGSWSKTSPKGFANSNGLLVYKSLEKPGGDETAPTP